MTRLAREFPSVAIDARAQPLATAPHVRVQEWRSLQFDPLAYDAPIRAQRPATLYVAGPRDGEGAAAALEILTRYQSLVLRRNARSATELFSRALARHRELHDTSKPLVAADYWHALDTWQWTLRLSPNASLELQLAALFHDVERLESEADARVEHRAAEYQAFKSAHAREGGRLAAACLRSLGVGVIERARVQQLIERHEVPDGDRELAVLNDADALSFLSLNSAGYVDYFGREQMRHKVTYTLARMRRETVARLARLRYRADVERFIVAALVRRPEIADWPVAAVAAQPAAPAKREPEVVVLVPAVGSAAAALAASTSVAGVAAPTPAANEDLEPSREPDRSRELETARRAQPQDATAAAPKRSPELLPVAEAELVDSVSVEGAASIREPPVRVGAWAPVRTSGADWLATVSVESALGWLAANDDAPRARPAIVRAEDERAREPAPSSGAEALARPHRREDPVATVAESSWTGELPLRALGPRAAAESMPRGEDPTSPEFWTRRADPSWAPLADESAPIVTPEVVPELRLWPAATPLASLPRWPPVPPAPWAPPAPSGPMPAVPPQAAEAGAAAILPAGGDGPVRSSEERGRR